MAYIPAQSLVFLTYAAELAGYPRAELARRSGLTLAQLASSDGRVAWADFIRLFQALADLGAGPDEFRIIGRHVVTQPELYRAVRITRAFLTPRAIHRVSIRWMVPRLFPLLAIRAENEGARAIRLHLRVPDDAPSHSGFFHFVRGAAMAATEAVGLPPAEVDLHLSDREGEFLIHLPRDRSLWNRAKLAGRLMFRSADVIEELSEQQHEINEHQAALLRSRRNFQHVIERLPAAVVIHRVGAIVYANAAAAEVLGLPAATRLIGAPLLDIVHPDDRARAEALFAGTAQLEPGSQPLRGRRHDGRELLLEAASTQVIEFDGREAGLTLLRDVTERRRLEEQLVAADRLSSLGAISAGVAHELNNPLAYITLNLRAMERAVDTITEETLKARAQEAAAAARHGVERATTIVRDLSSFSRPDKDSIEVVDLRAALDSAVGMLGQEARSRARLVRYYRNAAPVLANRARLEQVFLNLLLNALQSFPTCDASRNEIVLEVSGEADRAMAAVRDNGRGIPDEIRARIFDPLFTTKPVGEGTGLGLSICHGIITAAGGTVEVESTEGAGSAFTVVLPRAASAAHVPSPLPSRRRAPAARRRLLVIDDEPALLHALRAVLADYHDVEVTTNGSEALDRLRRDRSFDLILCDLIMGGLGGMDLHEELARTDPELAERVVFMTGGATTERARTFLATTSNRVLEKPFHFDKLLTYVEECVAAQPVAQPD